MAARTPTRLRRDAPLALELPAGSVAVTLRRTARSGVARLSVDTRGRVVLNVPPRTSRRAAEAILRERAGWVQRQLARLAERRAAPRVLAVPAGCLPLAGDGIPLERLGVRGPLDAAAVERWYRRQARARLEASVARHAPRIGVQPGRLSVRDQRTRWGSCSHRGNLSFSWRLVLAPPDVLDYVVVHELCHIEEHNHQPPFWRLVEAHCPSYREHRAWLREHGAELGAFEL